MGRGGRGEDGGREEDRSWENKPTIRFVSSHKCTLLEVYFKDTQNEILS